MIKLTLTPFTQPIAYIFEKKNVIIGKILTSEELPDLVLSHAEAHEIHVKIEWIGNRFIAINAAKDPYTTINERPFGKRQLQNGDLLQIGPTLLQFEGTPPEDTEEETFISNQVSPQNLQKTLADKMEDIYNDSSPAAPPPSQEFFDLDAVMRQLEEKVQSFSQLRPPLIEHKESLQNPKTPPATVFSFSPPPKNKISEDELEALLLEVSQLENLLENSPQIELEPEPELPEPLETQPEKSESILEIAKPSPIKEETPPSQPSEARLSIKDDLEEEPSAKESPSVIVTSATSSFSWRSFITAIGAFILLFFIVLGCLYYAVADRNEEEEIKAAQAVADVAMALNFAQINHGQPQNQNWSDPDFLNHNLTAVLASSYPPLANIDAQGQLKNSSYILRIYTGNDLNHFLIIAQPGANLLQWLLPKAAITVDSSFMELRKISDLKTLNRLLINATLDTSNSTKIAHLVNLGELIPLIELKKFHPHTGFDLPKALAYIKPGAENLIYNSARYYPLGESIMKKAIALYESDDNSQDLASLIDEINRFSKFPNIVLYSSEGIAMAEKGHKALATFSPNYKFLLAYLQFNKQSFITNSRLLMDNNETSFIALKEEQNKIEPLAESNPTVTSESSSEDLLEFFEQLYREQHELLQESPKENVLPPKTSSFKTETVDQKHSLYYKLIALYKAREEALKQIHDKINMEKSQRRWDNSKKLISLKVEYEIASEEWLEKIMKSVSELQQEYAAMPFSQFVEYIKATNIEPFIDQNLQNLLKNPSYAPFSREVIRSQINKIKEADSLKELDEELANTTHLLTLENFPDPSLLVAYQKEVHSAVVHKLDNFLLSPSTPLSAEDLDAKNRIVISHILKTAWVTDEGESEYYLNEFDLLLQNKFNDKEQD